MVVGGVFFVVEKCASISLPAEQLKKLLLQPATTNVR